MKKDKVMSLLRKKSIENKVSINMLLLLYFFEAFLEGISKSGYKSNLVLKGGFLLSAMTSISTRTTTDLDMLVKNRTMSKSEMKYIFEDIAEFASDEDLQFKIIDIDEIKIKDTYPGFRIQILGILSNIRQPFSVDIATGDSITPHEIEYHYKSIFDAEKTINILSYNLETIIAEKLETVVSRKTNNSRSKDFYDLYLIETTKKQQVDTENLRKAILNTFECRGKTFNKTELITDIENIRQNDSFKKRWGLFCKRNTYVREVSFDKVLDVIEGMIKNL